MSSNTIWQKMSLQFIENWKRASGSDHTQMYEAEFDDALIEQASWKNSRWEGSKLIGRKINEYSPHCSALNFLSCSELRPIIKDASSVVPVG